MRKLVFIHGRGQENQDLPALKAEWILALRKGLSRINLSLPIPESEIVFPYFGDVLAELSKGTPDSSGVIFHGGATAMSRENAFVEAIIEETYATAGIVEAQLAPITTKPTIRRGAQGHNWKRDLLKTLDTYVPGASAAGIVIAAHDVYQYLKNPGIRDAIEVGIRSALAPENEMIVVAHSLGTVISYNLLRRDGKATGWAVPLYVTLGSPLAVSAIKKSLRPIHHPACVMKWYNALDPRDLIALYPLDTNAFNVVPAIHNNVGVVNQSYNHHGISGYLCDAEVARQIHAALVEPLL